jgi:hypothetical protein
MLGAYQAGDTSLSDIIGVPEGGARTKVGIMIDKVAGSFKVPSSVTGREEDCPMSQTLSHKPLTNLSCRFAMHFVMLENLAKVHDK